MTLTGTSLASGESDPSCGLESAEPRSFALVAAAWFDGDWTRACRFELVFIHKLLVTPSAA